MSIRVFILHKTKEKARYLSYRDLFASEYVREEQNKGSSVVVRRHLYARATSVIMCSNDAGKLLQATHPFIFVCIIPTIYVLFIVSFQFYICRSVTLEREVGDAFV